MMDDAELVRQLREPAFERGLDEKWIDAQRNCAADRIEALVKERDEARARLATPAPDAVQEAAIDIAAIENGGKRWHGEDHRVVAVRWEPYKPDGQRQMKAKGRWQEQVGSGDYWRWQNCDRPAAARAEQIEKGEL